jgi:sugar (glycoside-pentoside-hexuronide) transporter
MSSGSFTRRISYASTDVAGQLVFCVISFYLLKFYTDVYGISAAAAGTILLVARLIDAVDAPVWGIIFDKTHSKWGRHRPWFLWLCVPFASFGVMTFLTPDFSHGAKVLYAGFTYIVCSILYTGINTPVTSILSSLSPDPRERLILTSFRMFGSKLGVLIVNLSAMELVRIFGGGDDRRGYMLVMPLYAILSVMLFLFAFRNLTEVVPDTGRQFSIRESFGALKGNWPWVIIFTSNLLFWIAFISRISAAPYFFEYTLGRKDLLSTAFSLDFVSLATILLMPTFARWISKRNIWIVGLAGSVLAQVVVYQGMLMQSVPLVMMGWILGILTSGIAMALPFSILAESVDYGEWRTGIRAAGLLTAVGTAFCIKAGSGLGGALPAWIMAAHDYVPNVAQSARSLEGISIGFIWLPAAAYALAILPVLFYQKYERLEPRIREELAARAQKS